ncbi:Nucleolar GTP-binding protein 2 [Klebsormidium nitens]|uniref:Nuclear/nucleolar GTPase 2 n=1 Tax=Klebsormidium nitens TaxID=105231 RepID=A0A1Y1IN81_KLENI|nr:Nucleolar GTP-binding protein 2 [Klebsormidium nitens]|eukprot:GAQ91582.1 Nucleolar GTP-binding protein 2 [Klebsormidium nitens]
MAKQKREKAPATPGKTKHSLDASKRDGKKPDKNLRTAATVRRLKMYKTRPIRDKNGKLVYEELQSKALPSTRIQGDRRWFGNTRVIGQKELEQFREEMTTKAGDAYTVLLKDRKLPMALLSDNQKTSRVKLLGTEPFGDAFGPKSTRKRPRLQVSDYGAMVDKAAEVADTHLEKAELDFAEAHRTGADEGVRSEVRDNMFLKGQSKRIWGELFKVLDSSDVVIQVIDARDPMGTRCKFLEHHLKKNATHKHLLLLLNKCDLVPAWVTKGWLRVLSREYPTLAFHASVTNPFGKGSLLSLLRQLARLKSDRQAISVGFVGYPNVGKSSVINTLRTKKVCKVAPIPGETKVWQYITLMKRINLIDCPGIVYQSNDTDTDIVLKGVVRVGNLSEPAEHVAEVLRRIKPEYLRRAYHIADWVDDLDFLTQLAKQTGKLGKGGEPDVQTAAKMVLFDWQRGKIPFFTPPPKDEEFLARAGVEAEGGNGPPGEEAPLVVRQSLQKVPVQAEMFDEDDNRAQDGAEEDEGEQEEEEEDDESVEADGEDEEGSDEEGQAEGYDEGLEGGYEEALEADSGGDEGIAGVAEPSTSGRSAESTRVKEKGASKKGKRKRVSEGVSDDEELTWEEVLASVQAQVGLVPGQDDVTTKSNGEDEEDTVVKGKGKREEPYSAKGKGEVRRVGRTSKKLKKSKRNE